MALDLLGEIVGSSSPEGGGAAAAGVYDPLASLPHHNHHHNLHESPDHVFAAHQINRGIPPSYYSTPSRSRNPDSTETVSERQQQHYMRDYAVTESGGRGGSTNVNEPRRETMMSNYHREQSSDMFSSQTSLELLGTPSIMPFVRDRNACNSVSSFGVATDKGEIVNGVGVAVGPPPNFNPLLFGNEQAPEDALQSYLLRNGYPNNNNNNNNNAASLAFGVGFNHTAAQDAIHADRESFFRNSHRALNPSITTLPHALPHPQATNAWLNSNSNNPVLLPGGEEDWQLRNMNAPLKNILQAEPLSGVNMGYSSHHSLSLSLSSPADHLRSSYQNWDWRLSHAGSFSLMRNSKYLKPVQHLLDEFCNVRVTTRKNPGKPHEASSLQSMQEENTPFQQSRGSTSTNINNNNNNNNSSSKQQLNGGAESSMANSESEVKVGMSESQMQVSIKADTHQHGVAGPEKQLHPEERSQLQMKKTRLISMVEEVDRRYRQYRDQMQTVITSFESATGLGGAAPYTTLARQTMSRHFKCLRDAISNEIRAICGTLGEEPSSVPVLTRGETPRLRILDQQLRHQRSLHQMGMLQQQPWRPQRGLPERAVSVLRAWLFEHFLHPYPKDSEKLMLARQTGLTRNQVSNWFINARVRLWKPMVEEMYVEEQKDLSGKSLQEGSRGKDERGNGMRDQKSMREVGSISSNWQQQGFSQGFESEKGSEEAPINMEGEVDMVQQYRSENMFVRDEQAMFMEALQEGPYHMSDGHMESNNNSRNMKSHFVLDSLQYGQGVDGRGLMQAGPSSTGISLTLGLQQHTASLLGDGPHAYNDAIHMNNSQW